MKNKANLIQRLEIYRLEHMSDRGHVLPELSERLMMAWIFHDNLLEGRSLNPEEIQGAIRREDHKYPTYFKPLLVDIRVYESAIEMIWRWGYQGPESLTFTRLKSLHKHLLQYEPKEGAKFRKNSPVHRDYHHKICAHTAIQKLIQAFYREVHRFQVDTQDVISYAAHLHHQLMHIYPFRRQPGALARLFTNQFLLSHGYPPMIIASHERGVYYDALASHDHMMLTQIFHRAMWRFLELNPSLVKEQTDSVAS